jgi:putative RNA 2'-phosphotransferase
LTKNVPTWSFDTILIEVRDLSKNDLYSSQGKHLWEGALMIDDKRLSKTMTFALRHKPWVYEMELDVEGWVDVEILLDVLRHDRPQWRELTVADRQGMMARADKQRFELKDGCIRARYGHSKSNSIRQIPAKPPTHLIHGTAAKSLSLIMQEGLKPMRRQFVHLSVDEDTATQVARRKGEQIALIEVDALRAYQNGIGFYQGNDKVWLADAIPADYLQAQN